MQNMEWDSYEFTLTESGWDISEACNPLPINLQPREAETLNITLAPHTTNSLLVNVQDATGVMLRDALVDVTRPGYHATSTTSACGQSFFNNLTKGSDYTVTVSKAGYQTAVENNTDVDGASRSSIILLSE